MPHVLIKPVGKLVELPQNSPLTDLEELTETDIAFGCRSGACGVCTIEVLKGISNLSEASDMERSFLTALGYPEERYRLACQCRLQGDIMVQPIDS